MNKKQILISLMSTGISEKSAIMIANRFKSDNCKKIHSHTENSINQIFKYLLNCIAELNNFEDEISIMLDFLTRQEANLDNYNYGRLMHLKALKSWKIDNDAYLPVFYLNRSIEKLKSCKHPEAKSYLPRVYDTSGQLLVSEGMLVDARREFRRALQGREVANDLHGKAITLGNLGRLSMQLGDFESAITYLSEDIDLLTTNDFYNMAIRAQLLSTTSACFIELENDTKADELNTQSLAINQEMKNHTGLAFNYLNSANIALLRRNKALAQNFTQKLDKEINHPKVARFLKENLKAKHLELAARLMIMEGDIQQAFSLFDQALGIFIKERSISQVETARLYLQIALLAENMEKQSMAGQMLRKALIYVDSTEEHKLRMEIEELMKKKHQDSWILHSAGRFIGHEHISFLLNEAGKGKFTGEEKEVVILFSDIRGFTSLSERLQPKELVEMLNGFLAGMTRAVEAYGGFVDKFIGDAVMAVFGLTNQNAGDKMQHTNADNAIMASLTMIEQLKRFNRNLPESQPQLQIGIGLHTGKVIAGLIGSAQKRSYTIIGNAVNTASRLEGMTKQLGVAILASKETCDQLTRRDIILRPLGRFCPKGMSDYIAVFDIAALDDNSPKLNEVKAECEHATKALDQFYQRNFAGAADSFKTLWKNAGCNKKAKGYKVLQRESKRMYEKSPGGEWKGEILLSEK
jgi:class 3 adenylate cyclase/tetratricopeptide (TPR) repeat protein